MINENIIWAIRALAPAICKEPFTPELKEAIERSLKREGAEVIAVVLRDEDVDFDEDFVGVEITAWEGSKMYRFNVCPLDKTLYYEVIERHTEEIKNA